MKTKLTAQRKSLCTLVGIAVGFRAFYAIAVDGGQLYGSGWIAMLLGLVLALPAAAMLIPLRRSDGALQAEGALERAAGGNGVRIVGALLFAVFVYDAGASIQMMSGMMRYTAMPEANRNIIKAVTAVAAVTAALMGTGAVADAAVLWKRLAAVLMGLIVLVQMRYVRVSWLTPVLGPGVKKLAEGALSAAGAFSLAAGGWLMLEPEHDRRGNAILKTLIKSGLIAAALVLTLGMLAPGMPDEPPTRSFRLGRLLANDRAGLSLEMPYVVLIYSCMLATLSFEVTAAAKALGMAARGMSAWKSVIAAGALTFAVSVSGAAESGVVQRVSEWYYPVIALPMILAGAAALIRTRSDRRKAGEA